MTTQSARPRSKSGPSETKTLATAQRARRANQIGDDFIFAVVFFAAAIALSSIGTKLDSPRAKLATVVLGAIMLVIGASVVVLLPQNIGFGARGPERVISCARRTTCLAEAVVELRFGRTFGTTS